MFHAMAVPFIAGNGPYEACAHRLSGKQAALRASCILCILGVFYNAHLTALGPAVCSLAPVLIGFVNLIPGLRSMRHEAVGTRNPADLS
jgi:hypothetical protein